MNVELVFHLLIFLLTANGVPILLRKMFGARADWPIDAGRFAPDGYRFLGGTKTWRGVGSSIVLTALLAPVLGYGIVIGALFAAYSMLGDLLSSFIKRRKGLAPSSRATGIDQLPEALVPLILLYNELSLDPATVVVTAVGFMLLEMVLSRLLYSLHIRRRPY